MNLPAALFASPRFGTEYVWPVDKGSTVGDLLSAQTAQGDIDYRATYGAIWDKRTDLRLTGFPLTSHDAKRILVAIRGAS